MSAHNSLILYWNTRGEISSKQCWLFCLLVTLVSGWFSIIAWEGIKVSWNHMSQGHAWVYDFSDLSINIFVCQWGKLMRLFDTCGNIFIFPGFLCLLRWFSHSVVSGSSMTPETVAGQAPLSMGFSRQEYWSGLPFLPPGDLPNSGIEPVPLVFLAMAGNSLLLRHLGGPCVYYSVYPFFHQRTLGLLLSFSCYEECCHEHVHIPSQDPAFIL